MRVGLGWLSEWIDLPGDREELMDRLTVGGLEIEDVIQSGPDLSALKVGAVVAREAHPDADRLSVCKVDLGDGEPLDIVCGAPNVAAGQKVAVATHGTVLPDGMKIKRSKIRGVKSNGMICSTRELGLGDEHEGILVLDPDAPVGAPLTDVLPAGDTVLDMEITPNRGDWVSMLGMAREVRAHFGGELRTPDCEPACGEAETVDDISVEIEDRAGCHRYAARVVRGVSVGPSPAWLSERLELAGVRSVNNVVDVTNLVMLEFGQPLHAFDLDKLRGRTIRVRAAAPGEKLVTLDGQERELRAEDLVIADEQGGVALAGVMGGADSEVSDATVNLLLESAHFQPSRVRRTARRLGLHSDASYRFERGVDPDGQARAASRAARLIQELAGGEVSQGVVEATGDAAPFTPEIALEPARVNRLLGTDLAPAEMIDLLGRVDVSATAADDGSLHCQPPRYRGDLHIPVDLIEEIARIHGYDRIEPSLPEAACAGVEMPPKRATRESVREALCGAGLVEIMSFPGAAEDEPDKLGLAEGDPRRSGVQLLNPIQAGESVLRTSLVPSVLRAARTNLSRQTDELRLFELSRVFLRDEEGGLPREPLQAVAVLSEASAQDLWDARGVPVFFRAKGIAERLLAELGFRATFQPGSAEPFLHPGAAGEFRRGDRVLVSVGELHPDAAARFEIGVPAALLVADVEALDELSADPPAYREVSRQPRTQRDLAVLLDRKVAAGEVLEAIRAKGGTALTSVRVFDRYEGKGVPEGKVSLAFRLVFQRTDRTLTEPEVTKAVEKVVQLLSQRFGGELR